MVSVMVSDKEDTVMTLTALEATKAQPKDKDYRLSAGNSLYLLVKTNGSKLWRMNYRFAGQQKTLAFGA
jgi:hypothetical protein